MGLVPKRSNKSTHCNINFIKIRNTAMGDNLKQFMKRLENRTYRCLQQTAKSLGLPSNYKKVYLIELIHAKKFRSEKDVETIINKVKLERCLTSKNKRDRSNTDKSLSLTTEDNRSPCISVTPKRPTVYLPFSPEERRAIMSFNSKRSLLKDIDYQNHTTNYKPNCDRVLRSFNLKSMKTQNYNIMLNNLNEGSKNYNTLKSKPIVKINTKEGNLPNYYLSAKCFVKKHKPVILNINNSTFKKPLILRQKELEHKTYIAAKQQNTISGIYPIVPYRTSPKIIKPPGTSVCLVRKNDGSLTKINAFIQNQYSHNIENKQNHQNSDINIQEIISCIEQSTANDKDLYKSQIQPVIERFESLSTQDTFTQTEDNYIHDTMVDVSIQSDYHQKKLEENMYEKRRKQDQKLPNINEVFTRFNQVKDVTQPIFVQVTADCQGYESRPYYTQSNTNMVMLEGLYNFKNYMLPNPSLLQIASKDNTKCIYTTPIMTMATAHQPASIGTGPYNYNTYEQDSRYTSERDASMYEYLQYPKQQQFQRHMDYNRSTSSTDTYQERSTPATIPEMVEDALEIISQDGDYMERIALEMRAACVVCSWAGPADVLQHHIETEHAAQVIEARGGEWRVSWSLGALARARRAYVLRHHAALYVLCAHYRDPERLAATLTSVSMDPDPKVGVITVYNKLTGQPYTWSGYLQQMYDMNEPAGLKVDISRLDLLPNSANVRILNRELVSDSSTNVIVGPPALNDINIVMYVKII